MLSSLSIDGYRRLRNFSVEDLGKINLLVGPNNSGKSSFLEALFTHCAPLNFQIVLSILSARLGGFILEPNALFEQIKWLISISDLSKKKVSITSKWNNNARETTLTLIEGTANLPFIRSTQSHESGVSGSSGTGFVPQINGQGAGILAGAIVLGYGGGPLKKREITIELITGKPLTLNPPPVRTDIVAYFSDAFMHRRPEAAVDDYSNAIKKGHHDKIIALLSKLDESIKDITILTGADFRPQLYVNYKDNGLMPISNLGDGIRRIILIASQIANCENGVLLIDEIESSIHEKALREFVRWLTTVCVEKNIQLFATTHSLECIDAVLDSEVFQINELRLFKMKQGDDGIHALKVDGETLREIRQELGQDIRW